MTDNPWTDARIQMLRELWPDPEMSAAKIADEIRGGLSRGAVIGKARRLNLGAKPVPVREVKPAPVKKVKQRNFGSVWGAYPDKEPEPFVPRAVALPSLDLPIEDWRDDRCKYIAGDDGLACGHPVKADKPYCSIHCALAYQAPRSRTPAQKAHDAKMPGIFRRGTVPATVVSPVDMAEEFA